MYSGKRERDTELRQLNFKETWLIYSHQRPFISIIKYTIWSAFNAGRVKTSAGQERSWEDDFWVRFLISHLFHLFTSMRWKSHISHRVHPNPHIHNISLLIWLRYSNQTSETADFVLPVQVKPTGAWTWNAGDNAGLQRNVMAFVTQHSIDEEQTGALTLINSSEADAGLTPSWRSYLQRCLDTTVARLPNAATACVVPLMHHTHK